MDGVSIAVEVTVIDAEVIAGIVLEFFVKLNVGNSFNSLLLVKPKLELRFDDSTVEVL